MISLFIEQGLDVEQILGSIFYDCFGNNPFDVVNGRLNSPTQTLARLRKLSKFSSDYNITVWDDKKVYILDIDSSGEGTITSAFRSPKEG